MLTGLNSFIDNCSRSWWKVLLLLIGQMATMMGLNNITAKFPELTAGDIPFDMQNGLQPEQIFSQLGGYTDAAFSAYYTFQAIDYVFPVVSSLFLAAVAAFGLRHAMPGIYAKVMSKNLLLLLLIPACFDWLENIFLLWAVTAWPEQVGIAAQLAVAAKMGKLSTMIVAFSLTGAFLLIAAGRWLKGKVSG